MTAVSTPCDAGVIRGAAGPEHGQPRSERWVLAASILGTSMAFIDGTVVNVTLPVLQQALDATATEMQWVIEGYALSLAALLLLGGALADRLGRRLIFVSGVALFIGASVTCGVAPNVRWLIVSRLVQGLGAALLVPTSLALLGACFPAERRGHAIGIWSAVSAGAAGAGPVLGGWLIQAGSWRWAFWINIPIGIATLAITFWRVPESRDPGTRRLDFPGAALATAGLGSLVFGLLESPRLGWTHPLIMGALTAALLIMGAFIWVEAHTHDPMLPPDLFRSRSFSGANLLTLFLYAALGGMFFFLPFNLIQVHGYTPSAAGAALLPFMALLSLLSGWAGGLVDRFGPRKPLIIGPVIAGLGFALLALPGTTGPYWTTFLPGISVLGLGMAITVAPLTTTVMDAAGSQRAGLASGVNNAVSRTAALLAIAVFGIIAYQRFSSSLFSHLEALGVSPDVRRLIYQERRRLAAAPVPTSLPDELRRVLQGAIGHSFVDAFRLVALTAAGLAVAAAVATWLMIGRDSRSGSKRRQ